MFEKRWDKGVAITSGSYCGVHTDVVGQILPVFCMLSCYSHSHKLIDCEEKQNQLECGCVLQERCAGRVQPVSTARRSAEGCGRPLPSVCWLVALLIRAKKAPDKMAFC